MKLTLGALLSGLLLGSLAACGEDAGDSADETGGTTSTGGKATTGGNTADGGKSTGGAISQDGGSKATGGTQSEAGGTGAGTGGKGGTGGVVSEDGGAAGEGGASAGAANTGGQDTGGTNAGGAGGAGGGGGGEGGGKAGSSGAGGAADACAGAMVDEPCEQEGAFCGGPCTSACEFCNVLRCQGGVWDRMEAFPAPCFECGADLSCQDGVDFCQHELGAAETFECVPAPDSCEGDVTCECVSAAVVRIPDDCSEAGEGQVTVTYEGG